MEENNDKWTEWSKYVVLGIKEAAERDKEIERKLDDFRKEVFIKLDTLEKEIRKEHNSIKEDTLDKIEKTKEMFLISKGKQDSKIAVLFTKVGLIGAVSGIIAVGIVELVIRLIIK